MVRVKFGGIMDDRRQDEKELQKRDEKDEKTNEKSAEEKSFEEKSRRDPLSTVIWAFILIWVGLVLLADRAGLLGAIRVGARGLPFILPFVGESTWTIIFAGIGAILLIEVAVRLLVPSYRSDVVGTLIGVAVMFGLAFGNWSLIWPLILVAIGLSLLLRGLFRRGGRD